MVKNTVGWQFQRYRGRTQTMPYRSWLPDCYQLAETEADLTHLRDEDRSHRLVQRCAVHVDGGADRQYEPGDSWIDVVPLFQAVDRDRERRWARGRAERGDQRLGQVRYVYVRVPLRYYKVQQGEDYEPVYEEADQDSEEVHSQLSDHLVQRLHLGDLGGHQEENAHRRQPKIFHVLSKN